ncbi:hypothetical protein MNBD_GAMMA03-298 [hydrothermal vent metagenome]|uniref:IPT/TIG domain-containing protein n=1 Tax=hydrothermal vent metagenome TaxID=652676 RepID=A0A3B0WID5_9ZZZZ
MKILKHLVAFALTLGISSMTYAAVTPPPVNQNMGIPDSSFEDFDASLCLSCHHAIQNDLDALSNAPVNRGYNPSRHHLAIGTDIDGKPEFPPFRDADGDGTNETVFGCLNCHKLLLNPATGETEIENVILANFRNCMNCHTRNKGPLTVHHATDRAQQGNCFQCHGGIVRGIDVEKQEGKKPHPTNPGETVPVSIPTYQTSMITPWRSKKPNGDASQENHAGTEPGNCNFCHNTADGNSGSTDEPLTLPNGETITIKVYSNMDNHHNTGFFEDGRCGWCHIESGDITNGSGFITDSQSIRICQRCHDRSSLHNIEFDAVGDGIIPGGEEPYFGHIGNQKNCWGCHGNDKRVQNEDGEWVDPRTNPELRNQSTDGNSTLRRGVSGALIPTITTVTPRNVADNSETLVTITGQSFVNSALLDRSGSDEQYEYTWTSKVVISDKDGNVTAVIEPVSQDATTIEFMLPPQTSGHYLVSLQKAYQVSNPLGLTVLPMADVDQAFIYTPFGSLVAIFGKDFMDSSGLSPNQQNGFYLVDQNGNAPIEFYLWKDDMIVALFADDPETVTLTNVFGSKVISLDKY